MADRIRFGAAWWRESLLLGRPSPRTVGGAGLVGGAALALGGCWNYPQVRMQEVPAQERQSATEVDTQVDALALQRAQGWNVGVEEPLLFPASSDEDVAHTQSWRAAMEPLAATLAPPEPYLPYYVPTLFQSLMGAAGQGLRAVMRPIATPEMQEDFQRGLALRQQFAAVEWPRDTAIVVDAPGPRAVALAAALADHFAPVFTFGNWPHPLGVVPAHQTLAAALYYLPAFDAARQLRPAEAPPIFVLDANRLASYRDADTEFDNRYFVSLPSAETLRGLGIKHLLYVSADGQQELDDLNDQLLGIQAAGLDVRMVALADFARAGDEPAVAGEPDEATVAAEEAEEAAGSGGAWLAYPWLTWWTGTPCHYWYRAAWWDRGAFWGDYRFYSPPRVVGPPLGHRVMAPGRGAHWIAAARPTMFGPASRVVAAPGGTRVGVMHPHAPANFATVPVRASRTSGAITGVRAGRVGSFGGFHGGFGGGGRSGSIGRAGGGVGG